jgi:5S rRNA maturation endonuclease (ribonuclease M5)
MNPIEKILERLPDAKKSGSGWMARCPAHDDESPSLSIGTGSEGKALVHCHADCATEVVLDAIGMKMSDLFPDAPGAKPASSNKPKGRGRAFASADDAIAELERKLGKRSAMWTYRNASGEPVGFILRWNRADGKDIRPVSLHADDWRMAAMPEPHPLYRLPELSAAPRVIVCEGEKSADAAQSLGFVATTSVGGSAAPKRSDWQPLAGKEVWILPDNDAPGRKYADTVAGILANLMPASVVRIIELSDLPDKGDIVDWIEAHGEAAEPSTMRAELEAVASQAEQWSPVTVERLDYRLRHGAKPAKDQTNFDRGPIWLSDLADAPPVEWLWYGRIPRGQLTILEGDGGKGKTMLLLDIASRLSRGTPLPDVPEGTSSARPQRTLILSAEDDSATLRCRVLAAGGDCTSICVFEDLMQFPNHGEELQKMVHDCHIDLVIVDPINSYLAASVNSHNDQETRRGLHPLREVARREGAAVVLVRHLTKSSIGPAANRGMGSVAFSAFCRSVLQLVPHGSEYALARAKGNNGKPPKALPFTIDGDDDLPKIIWGEPIHGSADELLSVNAGTVATNAAEACAAFIEKIIVDSGPITSKKMQEMAEKHGWTGGTFKRAQQIVKAKGIFCYQDSNRWMMGFHTPFDS